MKNTLLLGLAVLLLFLTSERHASAQTNDAPATPASATDAEIRAALARVTRHYIHPLADGDYPAVDALDAAKAARPPTGLLWHYPWGVADYGLLLASAATGDPAGAEFVREHNGICARYGAWLLDLQTRLPASPEREDFLAHTSIEGLLKLGNLDSCGMMGTEILEDYLRHPEQATPEVRRVLERIANWIVQKQDRLPDGTLCRSLANHGTVWPDDLTMACLFLVRWSRWTGERRFLDDAASQIVHQAALEQDSDGLWFHGYALTTKEHFPVKWGRANGWAAVATVEVLSALPEDHPARAALLDVLRRQITGLKRCQTSGGMWRQVLDQPDFWEETSCTAMFTYCIARAAHRGWIDLAELDTARRAFAGVLRQVADDGTISGTCEGTNLSTDLAYYANRKRPPNDFHGIGPVLMAGSEILTAPAR